MLNNIIYTRIYNFKYWLILYLENLDNNNY